MISKLLPSKGKLLLSEPFMHDPDFARSVVYITEHGDNGTMGFVINQASNVILQDLVEEFTGTPMHIYLGGPVGKDGMNFIHRCPDKLGGGDEISKGIYWGGDFEAVKTCIAAGVITPHDIRFMVGYSGWNPGQLDEEMEDNAWIVSDQFDADLIFNTADEELWKATINRLGPKYSHISNFPQNPNLN